MPSPSPGRCHRAHPARSGAAHRPLAPWCCPTEGPLPVTVGCQAVGPPPHTCWVGPGGHRRPIPVTQGGSGPAEDPLRQLLHPRPGCGVEGRGFGAPRPHPGAEGLGLPIPILGRRAEDLGLSIPVLAVGQRVWGSPSASWLWGRGFGAPHPRPGCGAEGLGLPIPVLAVGQRVWGSPSPSWGGGQRVWGGLGGISPSHFPALLPLGSPSPRARGSAWEGALEAVTDPGSVTWGGGRAKPPGW